MEEAKKKDTFDDFKAECKKIIWPSKPELRKQTITVIVVTVIMAAVIFGLDSLFTGGQNLILRLIGA
ncbi:MAG: preprotein translocase subunit SecE [Firmicutes bacterium]|nr:preprotein translocase subunit SecE [Bacillota bacterium]